MNECMNASVTLSNLNKKKPINCQTFIWILYRFSTIFILLICCCSACININITVIRTMSLWNIQISSFSKDRPGACSCVHDMSISRLCRWITPDKRRDFPLNCMFCMLFSFFFLSRSLMCVLFHNVCTFPYLLCERTRLRETKFNQFIPYTEGEKVWKVQKVLHQHDRKIQFWLANH